MTHDVQHSDPGRARVNGIEIVYDTFGDPSASPLLLVMGLGGQMIAWDEEFCVALAQQGYWVIRFDNPTSGCQPGWTKQAFRTFRPCFKPRSLGRRHRRPIC